MNKKIKPLQNLNMKFLFKKYLSMRINANGYKIKLKTLTVRLLDITKTKII